MGDPKISNPKIVSEPGVFKQLDEITIVSIPDMLRYCCAKITGGGFNESSAIRINSNTGQQLTEHHIEWLPQMIAGRFAVAIKGNKKIIEQETNENNKNTILVDIDADSAPELIKICASSDGIHITVWARSFESMSRIWHAYYYLSQDLEPNCSPEEISLLDSDLFLDKFFHRLSSHFF
ncbi:MAG: hypothetical protein HRU78_12765 [Gammaproteobacteria bacterium]|nr:MAG: hypothetical protein HRU78_12765 [Gammaproteobacteria bacterium]